MKNNNTNKKHLIGILALILSIISTILYILICKYHYYGCPLWAIPASILIFIITPISLTVSFICFDIIKPDP